jgi:hypothetical protein
MSAGAVRRRPHRHRAVSSPLPGMRTFITSLFFFMQESRPQESDSSSFTRCERPASESMNSRVFDGDRTGEVFLRTTAIRHSRSDGMADRREQAYLAVMPRPLLVVLAAGNYVFFSAVQLNNRP